MCGHTRSEHGWSMCHIEGCGCTDWEDETIAALLDGEDVREDPDLDATLRALQDLRATVLDEADSIAGRPLTQAEATLCALTLRTAAGQEASDE